MPWTVTRYEDRYAPWSVIKRPTAGLPNTSEEQRLAGDFADDEAEEDDGGGPDLTLCRETIDPADAIAAPLTPE